jgi:DNA repair photolyase
VDVTLTEIKNVLTRSTGFLKTVTSHSLQPYRGCSYGNSLCGVGCYVQHSQWVTKGRAWGGFLEVRQNAAESYLANVDAERRWANKDGGRFSIFMSSATDPFVPQETKYGVSRSILGAMETAPPDQLILQTHSHLVGEHEDAILALRDKCEVRVHISIETDMDSIPGLPPHASTVTRRFEAAEALSASGLFVVITVSPLLPIEDPDGFFGRIAGSASAVVVDHFIDGDGSKDGQRTNRTPLPDAIRSINPEATTLAYRDHIVEIAERHLPGKVGVNVDGFAGRYQ